MSSLLFSILMILLALLHVYTRYSRKGLLVDKIPGPSGYPIFGNVFMLMNVSLEDSWKVLRNLVNEYYPIVRFWIFHYPIIGIRHPDDLEIILTSQKSIEKGLPYKFFHQWLKTGLLTSKGEKWRQRRKLLTQPFHFNILNKNVNVVNDHGDRLIQSLRVQGKESVQSVLEVFTKCTMNITVDSAMDVDMDKMDGKTADEYREAVDEMGRILVFRTINPFVQDWMLNSWTKFGRVFHETIKILHEFTDRIVKERRDYHEHNHEKFEKYYENFEKTGTKKKLPMLDLLLSAEKDGLIDDEGIKEEVNTFLFGGTDTSQTAMAYTLLLLSEHKEIQDKVREEITPILKESKGEVGIAELQKFPYLERCIKEAMRLYPVVPMIFRYTTEDIQLKNYVVPAGVNVVCLFYDIHRDINYWADPDKFDPDRFLPQNSRRRHPFAYLPFSAGPRNCIGQKFGMMVLKSVLSRIVYNFYLEPVTRSKDLKMVTDIVLRPSEHILVKFIRIDSE